MVSYLVLYMSLVLVVGSDRLIHSVSRVIRKHPCFFSVKGKFSVEVYQCNRPYQTDIRHFKQATTYGVMERDS